MNQRRPKPDRLNGEFFWTDRWEGSSAQLLPLEPRGLYREMLTAAWRRGAWLPKDPETIRRAIRVTPEEWARCWPKIEHYWHLEGERLVNDVQLEVYRDAVARRAREHEKALKAAAASPQVIRKREREARGEHEVQHEVKPGVEQARCTPLDASLLLPSRERESSVLTTDSGNGRTDPGLSPRTPRAERERYIREVLRALEDRGGVTRGAMLGSSVDFVQAGKWYDAGVPLRVVLSGIAECRQAPPSLAYARPAVQEAIERWSKAVPQ